MPIGVYISRCSGDLEPVLDVDELAERIAHDAEVVRVIDELFSAADRAAIAEDVAAFGLDGVVIAGISPDRIAKSLSGDRVLESIAAAGINPNRISVANLREQVALAHPNDPEGARAKAVALVRASIAMVRLSAPVEATPVSVRSTVLFLGATPEAMVSAQRLTRVGFRVVVAERDDIDVALSRGRSLRGTIAYALGDESVVTVSHAKMADGHGWVGDFSVALDTPEGVLEVSAAAIVLARPDDDEWVAELRQHFRLDVDDDGHARSIDPELHPAETVNPGIYVLPSHESDASSTDRVASADAVAMAVLLDIGHSSVVHYHDVSAVDPELCGGCAACVRTCAFGACSLADDGLSHVDPRRCRACGKCVVACPVGARDIVSSPHDALMAAVGTLARAEGAGPRVLGFLCAGCGYPAADAAGTSEDSSGYPASFMPLRIPCGGRLDALYVLEAFRVGFDAVSVYRCREGHCHNLIGNLDMDRRINLLRTVLRSRGIDDARLRIVDIAPGDGAHFLESVAELYEVAGAHGATATGQPEGTPGATSSPVAPAAITGGAL